MVIEKLTQKYKCGCGRGMAKLEIPGILGNLNTIIEWENSTLPEGDTAQELVPGDCFLENANSQVIAVDGPDVLVLVLSETGPGALQRIWDEKIKVEFDMLFGTLEPETEISWRAIHELPKDQGTLETYTPPFPVYKLWKDRFVAGRGFVPEFVIETEYKGDLFFFDPVTVWMTPWTIKYNPSTVPSEMIETVASEILQWFYRVEPRVYNPHRKDERDEAESTNP
jgi:hypothetical protein